MSVAVPAMPSLRILAKRLFDWARKSAFVRNLLVVMTGTAVAQVVGFALSPVISRLFSPSDFGVFGSFGAVSGVIAAGVTLEYTQAIMLPKAKEDAINLFLVSCACTLGVGFICLLCCLVAPGGMNSLMRTEGVWMLVLLVLATVMAGLNSACQAWCVRVKAFRQTSASQVIRSLSSNGSQIGLGVLSFGAPGLVISSVLADLLATLMLSRSLIPDLRDLRSAIRWERMKQLALEYRDFPLFAASQNVINAVSLGLPVLLLSHSYSLAIAGAYAFGMRILGVPMSFVISALRQVLFQKACETHHQGGSLVSLYFKTTGGLVAIGILPSLVLFIWSPQIFSWLFGSQWLLAGEFARSLILWLLFAFCNLPAVLFARLIRIQRTIFFYDLVMLAARFITLAFGGMYLPAAQTIMLFAVVGAVMNAILIVIVGRAVMQKQKNAGFDSVQSSQ